MTKRTTDTDVTTPVAQALRAYRSDHKHEAFAIITGKVSEYTLEVDQICGTEREARKEVKDLKAMGFDDARFKPFATWAEAEEYQDKARGY